MKPVMKPVMKPEVVHVDDFIDDRRRSSEAERYARFFFEMHRRPAWQWAEFGRWMERFELYATHRETGKRWRIVGCSSMGDVYVKELKGAPVGTVGRSWQPYYDDRGFMPTEFKDWSDTP